MTTVKLRSYSLTTIAALIGSFLGTMGGVIVVVTSLSSPVKAMSKRIIIVISLAGNKFPNTRKKFFKHLYFELNYRAVNRTLKLYCSVPNFGHYLKI